MTTTTPTFGMCRVVRKPYAIVKVFAADGFGCSNRVIIPSLGIDRWVNSPNMDINHFDTEKYEVEATPWVNENPGISRTEYWYEK